MKTLTEKIEENEKLLKSCYEKKRNLEEQISALERKLLNQKAALANQEHAMKKKTGN
jgi:restriction endonuclease S subunit